MEMVMNIHPPVVAILRGVESGFFEELMPAAFSGGLKALEVTMNTRGALEMVRKNRHSVPADCLLGMGTVCNIREAKSAVDAGAMFIVSPNTDQEVIEYGVAQNIPVIAGALTPTEIYSAWSAGASMVKVFPCGSLGGPSYIKNLRGPFDKIPLLAVGGVTTDSLRDYFAAGVTAVGVGASFFGRQALADKNINELTKNVKNYIESCEMLL
jgi:2-dehydro-3-deoxyphosphogluconate aldolase/(4S)-4-hydroxy-2-oxoglutarate aldolase